MHGVEFVPLAPRQMHRSCDGFVNLGSALPDHCPSNFVVIAIRFGIERTDEDLMHMCGGCLAGYLNGK